MKTGNNRHLRSSGMVAGKLGKSRVFLFSRRVPDFCDGQRSFPRNGNLNLYCRRRRRQFQLVTNPLNCIVRLPWAKRVDRLAGLYSVIHLGAVGEKSDFFSCYSSFRLASLVRFKITVLTAKTLQQPSLYILSSTECKLT